MSEMKDVTVGIKSFLRARKLNRCLSSLHGMGFEKVVVSDDGPISEEKRGMYERHKEKIPLEVLELERDSGLSYGRNRAFEECDTRYFLLLDDDQAINEDIIILRDILKENRYLGGVSGFWREKRGIRCSACNIHEYRSIIVKDADSPKKERKKEGYEFYVFDQINNSTLFRSSTLRDISWDPFYKIGMEHTDFYLNHKNNSEWEFAVTPNVLIDHYPSTDDSDYSNDFRSNNDRLQRSRDYFRKKWSVNRLFLGTYFKNNTRHSIKQKIFSFYVKSRVPEALYYLTERLANIYKKASKFLQ
jgi:glycosyltransferase involved in cell wall biosynthesis